MGASQPAIDMPIRELLFDSRKASGAEGELFLALKTGRRDGHDFAWLAHQRGVRAFVVERQLDLPSDAHQLIVSDLWAALRAAARTLRNSRSYPVVAIGGSAGKTWVKEWLAKLLSADFAVYRSPLSYNSQLGVALSLLGLPESLPGTTPLALIEAGVSAAGDMQPLADMIRPNMVVLTHLGAAHDGGFSSRLAKAQEKALLVKDADVVVYPADQPEWAEALAPYRIQQPLTKFISFGESEGAKFRWVAEGQFEYRAQAFEAPLLRNDPASRASALACLAALFALERLSPEHIKALSALQPPDAKPSLEGNLRGTFVEVDLDAMRSNYRLFRHWVKEPVRIMAMVKALGYGSGTFETAKVLASENADAFGVAYPEEGIALRKAGLTQPILVMNVDPEALESCIEHNLEPVVHSWESLEAYAARLKGRNGSLHLEIDTGMHRLGFDPSSDWGRLAQYCQGAGLHIQSIFSHLVVSEDPSRDAITHQQAADFQAVCQVLESQLGYRPLRHLANTGGILRFPQYHFDMVRLGLGLYGLDPSGEDLLQSDSSASKLSQLSTVTRWVTRISAIRSVPAGEGIGYGSHSASEQERQIATLAVGYADGLSRHLSQGKGSVWIKGQLAPIVGNICMDLTMIDVSHLDAQVGDEVELFGPHLSINRQAQQAGTISYELLTSISQRVARVYLGEW